MLQRVLVTVFTIALLLLAGCAHTARPPTSEDRVQTRVYEAPYEEVYEAALEAAGALRWEITAEDKEGGLITAATPEATPGGNYPKDIQEDTVDIVFLRQGEGVRVEVTSALRYESNIEAVRGFLDDIATRLQSDGA